MPQVSIDGLSELTLLCFTGQLSNVPSSRHRRPDPGRVHDFPTLVSNEIVIALSAILASRILQVV